MAQIGMIYIGTFAQADTDESNWSAENPNLILGTHAKTALKPVVTSVSTPLNDGIAYDDDHGQTASKITYDLGNGAVTATQDSVEAYNVTVTLGNGTQINTVVNVIQLTNGATFINESADGIPLDNLAFQSIKINSLRTNNAAGWRTVRSIDQARIVCFARNTRIATPGGHALVQDLAVGDRVITQDHGPQRLVWRATSFVASTASTYPVTIAAGALGPQMPSASLQVSPQHRMVLHLPAAAAVRAGGEARENEQIFVAAKKLVGMKGITQAPAGGARGGSLRGQVEYHHIMCARHEVIFANGAACESFFPGPMALEALNDADLQRLNGYFARAKIPLQEITLCRPSIVGKPLKTLLASLGGQAYCRAAYA